VQAGLLKTGFARRYVAGRHSEMKRSGIELRGRTGIAPGSKAGRHSEMKRSGIELRGRTGIIPGSRAGRRWRNTWNKNKIEEDESDENL